MQGRYEEACDYFNKAYTLARARNDNALISSSRVQFGIAQAHKMNSPVANQIETGNYFVELLFSFSSLSLFRISADIYIIRTLYRLHSVASNAGFCLYREVFYFNFLASRQCVKNLLDWKSSRTDNFQKKIEDAKGEPKMLCIFVFCFYKYNFECNLLSGYASLEVFED